MRGARELTSGMGARPKPGVCGAASRRFTDGEARGARLSSSNRSTEPRSLVWNRMVSTGAWTNVDVRLGDVTGPTVSDAKAHVFKPECTRVHHGWIMTPGRRRWEPLGVVASSETP